MKKHTLVLKQKAIKIFIQAEYLIVKARTLDEWAKIEFLPLSAHDIQLSKVGNETGKSNAKDNGMHLAELSKLKEKYNYDVMEKMAQLNA